MKVNSDVIIIGGGLAGLTAAIHLSKFGLEVTIIEKNEYPKHKVCGEYISNEVLPYFEYLDVKMADLMPSVITKMEFSSAKGKIISADLPLGGFGISRFELDYYLVQKAIENGCQVIQDTVTEIEYVNEEFFITTANNIKLKSRITIGAYGKRSNIDQKLNRNFIQKKSPWLAVKGHYAGEFPNNLVGLHNFKGGYCGVSKVENSKINICYLVDYETFKRYQNIEEFQSEIILKNPNLKLIFENSKILFEKPLTISQISFEKKDTVENHILMIGDTAGLIHPLCGNGMAMAIHSAKIVSELILKFYDKSIVSRKELEKKYTREWNYNFRKRLKTARILSKIMLNEKLTSFLIQFIVKFPNLLPKIIKKTHGKPIL
ncbi:NAD(P)/FAD-dependent oxidoreductase [Flavobacterium cellulosilyticum]|uniref:NAD(P)/FAD-dependent oxidoreductase n=1 Tax=Flavobacterium cellulosilyticum TaxID=2541731 RepID=A0A4R5C715_9FLAO|nr:NAD(P)/FAD-dependent oxidoreductase [Flavobacterium cellulosilyticum]TDD94875.1 NAD(P)/FAD-dependent oxidoreductase [Flavobacterium cellulosilyticum]